MMQSSLRGLWGLKSLLAGKGSFCSPKSELPRDQGTYILLLRINSPTTVRVTGGFTELKPGIYAYVGSAFGPGGLRARIHRHWRKQKKKHWHIDWITTSEACEHIGVLVFPKERAEQDLARLLTKKYPAVHGFGATDSNEDSHLFKIG